MGIKDKLIQYQVIWKKKLSEETQTEISGLNATFSVGLSQPACFWKFRVEIRGNDHSI